MKLLRKSMAAACAAAGLLAAGSAVAGNVLLTGHDTDDHLASTFMNWGLTYLTNNGNATAIPATPTARIGYLGNSAPNLNSYFGNYNNFAVYDLDSPTWTNAFTDGNSVLVIGSGSDFINSAGSAALNSQQAAFSNYINSGGSIFVNTHQGLGDSFYGFLPPVGNVNASPLTTCTSETGNGACMAPTAAGAASGLTLLMITEADITHNQFSLPAGSPFTGLETYVPTGNFITIGLIGATVGSGGFSGNNGGNTGGNNGGNTGGNTGGGGTVPLPGTVALLAMGLAGLGAARLRRS